MKQDYKKIQEEIMPGRETQDWMWDEIEKKAAAGGKKQHSWAGLKITARIAAAVLLFVILIPQTSWAEQLRGFLKEFFYAGASAGVSQGIAQNVYEDEGKYGHVRMQIREMLSDGSCVYCNICYEALDAEGEKWLKEQKFDGESIRFPNVTGGWTLLEQKEQATEKERHFALYYENNNGKFQLKDQLVTMYYPMYKSQGIGAVKIVSNLASVSYRLVGEKSPSQYYEPRCLVVSRLSYAIFGKDHGISAERMDKDGTLHLKFSEGFLAEKGEDESDREGFVYFEGIPLTLTMNDGSKLDMGYVPPFFDDTEGSYSSDLLICSGQFNVDREEWYKIMPIDDPGALVSIELDGVHYDLVKEEAPDAE